MNEQSERLRELRKKHLHMSQQEFADSLFMKRNSVAQFETGLRNPSERTMKMVADVHNVNLDWITNGTLPIFNALSREEEIAQYMGYLTSSDDPDFDFQKRFIRILAQLSVNEWEMIESIVNRMIKEKD